MENKTIITVILISILLLYVTFFAYILVRYVLPRRNSNRDSSQDKITDKKENKSINLKSPYQTDFFNDSAEHAKKVLFRKQFIQEYGESQYYGNKLLDTVYKLNDETKENIIIAIKSMCIEPGMCRNNEKAFRFIAESEKVPVWFIILREAVKKVVPEFMQASDVATSQSNNVVPLYATG